MIEPTFRSHMTVELVDSMGGDASIVRAARVSTRGANEVHDREDTAGLLRYLMRDRHGSPFEHVTFTFYVHAPIFVFREFQRHRIASYNEESGRYRQLQPVFYVPDRDRNLRQVGRPGAYTFTPGTPSQFSLVNQALRTTALAAYRCYEELLGAGVAREVARMCLPLNTYSSMYVTVNARALMNFLSLRVADSGATFPSSPQREIEMCAQEMERIFALQLPVTHSAFVQHGRVAP